MTQIPGLTDEMWSANHYEMIEEFLAKKDKKILVIYLDKLQGLTVKYEIPPIQLENFTYFVKSHYTQEITKTEEFLKYVQFGNFNGKHLHSLLRLTSGLYAPLFFGNKNWPDSKSFSQNY